MRNLKELGWLGLSGLASRAAPPKLKSDWAQFARTSFLECDQFNIYMQPLGRLNHFYMRPAFTCSRCNIQKLWKGLKLFKGLSNWEYLGNPSNPLMSFGEAVYNQNTSCSDAFERTDSHTWCKIWREQERKYATFYNSVTLPWSVNASFVLE